MSSPLAKKECRTEFVEESLEQSDVQTGTHPMWKSLGIGGP